MKPNHPMQAPACFFENQTMDELVRAVQHFNTLEFDPNAIRSHALTFDRDIFKSKIQSYVDAKLAAHRSTGSERGRRS